ncbi:hypothetical protein WSM22_26040 [Cytophagales bacterium WSM2-2]|nr:hypothetical protein WSM22_26040 [Cytophagales bacterium WSM2-2]
MISGIIIDKETHKPLELVAVAVIKNNIGTNTNAEGKFTLALERNTSDSLRFSMIGYKSKAISLSTFENGSTVELTIENYSLREVTVVASKITANDLIKEAILWRKKNYDYESFKLEAYYRELGQANGKYNHLIEIAMNTYGKNIDHYHQAIELVESRKIDFMKAVYGENLLNSTLRLDFVANPEHFDFDNFKKNKYEIESVQSVDSRYVYVVTSGKYPDRTYKFFIDEETRAIIRCEMDLSFNGGTEPEVGPLDKTHQFRLFRLKVINIYREYEGKYYPDYIHVLWEFDKYDLQTKTTYEKGNLFREFKVNRIITKNKSEPDPSRLMVKFGATIDTQVGEYHADFWKNFTTVPLTSEVIRDLGQGQSLEDQFAKSKKR